MGAIITIAVYAISSLLVVYCNVQIFGYLLEAKKERERNEKICTPFNSTINEYESKKNIK